MQDSFRTLSGDLLSLPLFFPDATRGKIRTLNFTDVLRVGLPGILVNTFHLLREVGTVATQGAGGIARYLGWNGAIISDSGGFQVMSIAKRGSGHIDDEGVTFVIDGVEHLLTPVESIKYQLTMQTDLCVVLDDFTPPDATYEEAEETVRRTTLWAKRCRATFDQLKSNNAPYLIGVIQGGSYPDLRQRSIAELSQIGFDGYGYGGWPMKGGVFDIETARLISDNVPRDSLLYGLGIGKPDDIVACVKLGWQIFDCVLPTRDARHGRLYVYTAPSLDTIDVTQPNFYSYYNPRHSSHLTEEFPVSSACDCELCTTHSRAQLATMWRARDNRVLRLATIHNLRFYAILMEKLRFYHLKCINDSSSLSLI